MPYSLATNPVWAECPCCFHRVEGWEQIEKDFGFRTIASGQSIPQSYCRACRSAHCEEGQPCKVSSH